MLFILTKSRAYGQVLEVETQEGVRYAAKIQEKESYESKEEFKARLTKETSISHMVKAESELFLTPFISWIMESKSKIYATVIFLNIVPYQFCINFLIVHHGACRRNFGRPRVTTYS